MKFTAVLALLAITLTATALPVKRSDLVIPIASLNGTEETVFTSCGDDSDSLRIDSVKITPDPPKIGADLVIDLAGNLAKVLEAGSNLNIRAYLGFIEVKNEDVDLCTTLNLNCPFASGQQAIHAKLTLPTSIPAGVTIKVELRGSNVDQSEIFCLSGDLNLASADGMLPVHRQG